MVTVGVDRLGCLAVDRPGSTNHDLLLPLSRVLGSSPGAGSAYGYKQRHKDTLAHTLLFDLVVDPLDAYVLTADQGGVMRMWDSANGSVMRSIQPEVGAGKHQCTAQLDTACVRRHFCPAHPCLAAVHNRYLRSVLYPCDSIV
jgi:hypothetical protein